MGPAPHSWATNQSALLHSYSKESVSVTLQTLMIVWLGILSP